MFCFIVFLLLLGAGFYFYQKLKAIEIEIRTERADKSFHSPVAPSTAACTPEPEQNIFDSASCGVKAEPVATVAPEPEKTEATSLQDAILTAVKNQEGMKQTELYELFSATNKKQLQQLVKDMADNDLLRREKKGSSYLLHVA